MQTYEINYELSKFKCFKGTYAHDLLPIKVFQERPIAFVINTDASSAPGEHWVALFIDENNEAEYFDSFGFTPMHSSIFELIKINDVKVFKYNKYCLQSALTSTCGAYCILFIKMRCHDIPFIKFISLFSKNRIINDYVVCQVLDGRADGRL